MKKLLFVISISSILLCSCNLKGDKFVGTFYNPENASMAGYDIFKEGETYSIKPEARDMSKRIKNGKIKNDKLVFDRFWGVRSAVFYYDNNDNLRLNTYRHGGEPTMTSDDTIFIRRKR